MSPVVETKSCTSTSKLRAKELMDMIGELRRSEVEKDEHVLNTFDELSKETMEILKKKRISLTVEDFLKERER